jgi:hypothetical protein
MKLGLKSAVPRDFVRLAPTCVSTVPAPKEIAHV